MWLSSSANLREYRKEFFLYVFFVFAYFFRKIHINVNKRQMIFKHEYSKDFAGFE